VPAASGDKSNDRHAPAASVLGGHPFAAGTTLPDRPSRATPRLTVLSVPGHTDGSIALHLPADGVLFTGDLIAEWNGDIVQGPFNVDPETAARSARRLAALSDVDIACFGHGEPLLGRPGDRLRPLRE
jgi:glyoxylase-like metal-dependent hydrolase (beta-lactamase superfamily II)